MIYKLALLLLAVNGIYGLTCSPSGNVLLPNSGLEFPPNLNDSNYGPNTNCNITILSQTGKYLKVTISSNVSASDSLVIKDDKGLNVSYRNGDENNQFYSPINIQIQLNAQSSGFFRVVFEYLNYNSNPPTKKAIAPGGTGVFLESPQLYTNYYIISCNSSLTVQAQTISQSDPFVLSYMYTGFIFAGEGTNGTYLGSLYTAWNGQYLRYDQAPYTITVVSVTLFDYGIALVKPLADVTNYNVFLDYAQSSSIGQKFPLDAATNGKPTALTLFNNNETVDFYLSSVIFSGLGKGGVPSLSWQTGDLRPSMARITNYYANNTLAQLPQVIPGRLNTFIAQNDIVQLGFTLGAAPSVFSHVPSGTSTYFTSKNMPFVGLEQSHLMIYATDYLRARVTVNYRLYTVTSAPITVSYYPAGYQNALQKTISRGNSVSFIGQKFIFSYPASMTNGGAAAYITFVDDGHIPPNNNTGSSTTLPPGGKTPNPKVAQHLGASLLVLILSFLAII